MSIYAPQVGLNRMLSDIIADTLTLRLFSNNVTPAATDTSASYTEVTGGGYAALALGASSNWTVTSGNPSIATYNSFQQFNFSGAIGGSGNVYGYYITRVSGEVVIAERLPSGSIPFTPTGGSYIKVRPQITLDNTAASSSAFYTVLYKSGNYTIQTSDGNNVLIWADASLGSITISPYTAVGNIGASIQVVKLDASANTVTIDPNGSETIAGATTVVLSAQNAGIGFVSEGTNWVQDVVANTYGQVLSKTSDYTIAVQDGNMLTLLCNASGASFTVTLPTVVGHKGLELCIKKTDTSINAVTIDGNGAESIDGALTWDLVGGNSWVTIVSSGAAWYVIAKGGSNIRPVTTTYTTQYSDDVINCTTGTFTVNLIDATTGTNGKQYIIKNSGSGVITVDASGAQTIDGSTTVTLNPYDSLSIVSDGSNWNIV